MNCRQFDSPFYSVWFGVHRYLCRLVCREKEGISKCILCRQMGYIWLHKLQTLNDSHGDDFKKGL